MALLKRRSEYGSRLLAARKHAGYTQTQLAAAVGMSQASYNEAERVGAGSVFTAQLAAACGVSGEWLAAGKGEMLATGKDGGGDPSEEFERAISLIARVVGETPKYMHGAAAALVVELFSNPRESANISRNLAEMLFPSRVSQKVSDHRRSVIVDDIYNPKDESSRPHGTGDSHRAEKDE